MQAINKAASPSQNQALGLHGGAWSAVLLRLDQILCGLQSRIHRMRMDRPNEQKHNFQTYTSGKYGYQPELSSSQNSYPLSSQLGSEHADDLGPASRVAQDVNAREIGPCDAILGYEIINGREHLIWGKAPDYPWADINGKAEA